MAINHNNIYNAFALGAQKLSTKRQQLNDINVFPVADGDTGTNMVSTLNSVLRLPKGKSLQEVCDGLSDTVSLNARGNSGAILAQFVIGFTENISEPIQNSSIVHALNAAVDRVFGALSHPVEGTIITVMKDWAQEVQRLSHLEEDLKEVFEKAMIRVQSSLENTPNILKVLKEYHVVDSGAKGFVHFIEGFIEGLFKEEIDIVELDEDISIGTVDHDHDAEITERFCTEFLLENAQEGIDYKAWLEPLGSSLLVVQSKKRVKIHIHTNNPEVAARKLSNYGDLIQQKVDDMVLQNADLRTKQKIALITDSIADLPDDLRSGTDIHVFPLTIMVGQHAYLDRSTLTARQFYEDVDTYPEYPSSSQPSVAQVEKYYSQLLAHYSELLVVSVSSGMSGTYSVFSQAAEKLKNVHVFDTKVNSVAQGLLVLHAHNAIQAGKSIDDILSELTQLRDHTKIFVSVNTLKYMVKMGRVSARLAKIAAILNMKPVVSIDEAGKGITLGSAFSNNQSVKRVFKELDKALKGRKLLRYAIVHGNDLKRAEDMAKTLTEKFKMEPSFISEISTIVAMSAGPKTFAIALQSTEK